MLNAHKPKIVNGPEILQKFVGQSEENVRRCSTRPSSENKLRGDKSKLHIIVFDEIDAVMKARGSGRGDGERRARQCRQSVAHKTGRHARAQ